MNVLSLFAGIGGLDLGLERAGMTVVGQVEIDPFCRAVLEKHWPEVPRHDDVRTAVEWWLGRARPAVDVVCGGFPCQPVSLAGRGRAQADERWLWPATWAVIRDLRPAWAVLENVPGLLGRGMGDVLADLAEIGYDAEWDCVPAAAVGALHRRDRVFVVAYPGRATVQLERNTGELPTQKIADGSEARPHVQGLGTAGDRGPAVADAAGQRRHVGAESYEAVADGRWARTEPSGRGLDLAHANSARRDEGPRLGWSRAPTVGGGRWNAEPDVGRVAHGVPRRVDRLRALGNAVVPQVAEHVGRLVMGTAA